jgi:hypothetical protein
MMRIQNKGFYISFNLDQDTGSGGAKQVTLSGEEHTKLVERSAKLDEITAEKSKLNEEHNKKVKQLEENIQLLTGEKEKAVKDFGELMQKVKTEYLEKLSDEHKKIAELIPTIEGIAEYVKLNEKKQPAGTDTARPGAGSRDLSGTKWDDLNYEEKEDLRSKRPSLWKKLYREKFGSNP